MQSGWSTNAFLGVKLHSACARSRICTRVTARQTSSDKWGLCSPSSAYRGSLELVLTNLAQLRSAERRQTRRMLRSQARQSTVGSTLKHDCVSEIRERELLHKIPTFPPHYYSAYRGTPPYQSHLPSETQMLRSKSSSFPNLQLLHTSCNICQHGDKSSGEI